MSRGVVILDASGVVVDCDAGAAACLGRPARDLLGRPWSELAPAGAPAPIATAGGAVVVIGAGPEPEAAVVARRAVELGHALRDARRTVADADAFAEGVLDSMTHQLRTPLATILGTAEALADEAYGPLGPRARTGLRAIEDAGRALLAFVEDILDVSKSSANRLELHRAQVDLAELVKTTVEAVAADAQARQIRVTSAVAPGLAPEGGRRLVGDARRLQRALRHLLDNALRFSVPGGAVDVQVVAEGDSVQLLVTDTGPGMEAADLLRAGRPFSSGDGARPGKPRMQPGPGLGLAYARRVAELHGGALRLSSVPGRGTVAGLVLPLGPAGAVGSPQLLVGERPSRLILIADADVTNVETMSTYLRAKGFRVEAMGDGPAAVAAARELRPDAIVMDVHMPGFDGIAAIGRIREDAADRTVPIVAVAALAMRGDRERYLAAGASEYLAKPVSLRGLEHALESLLRRPPGSAASS